MSPADEVLHALRVEACQAAGLPATMASRLRGDTREAVFTDARLLAKESQPAEPATGEAQALARAALRNAAKVRSLGPGVSGGQLAPAPIELPDYGPAERLVQQDDGE